MCLILFPFIEDKKKSVDSMCLGFFPFVKDSIQNRVTENCL